MTEVTDQSLKVELVSDGAACVQTGSLHSAEAGVLRVETGRGYDEGEPVLIRIGPHSVRGHVVYSVHRDGTFRTAIALLRGIGAANRRHSRRVPVRWKARVNVMGERAEVFTADMIDISSTGFGLQTAKPLHISDQIAAETESCVCFGEIVHCRPLPNGKFRLGVQLTELLGAGAPEPVLRRVMDWLRSRAWRRRGR